MHCAKCGIAAAAAVSAAMVWLGATGSQEAKAQAPGAAAKLALVKDGNALATIVIPAQASQTEAKAAGELQQFLLRLSGAKLPIQKDAADVQGTAVSVGLTKLVPEEVRKELAVGEKLAVTDSRRDSFLTRARGNTLLLVGHRDEATLYSVYHFLAGLGCRWFFGCQAGEVVPHAATISLGTLDDYQVPDFAARVQFQWGSPLGPIVAGHRQDWMAGTDGAIGPAKDQQAWLERNLLSPHEVQGDSGHNYAEIWPDALFAKHPEYFGMVNGKRDKNAQPCLSNPDVIKIGIQWAEKTLHDHPENDIVTFAPKDGNPYCQCAACKALGNPADQNMHLGNEVAKAIAAKYPDKMVAIWAYADGAVAPHIKAEGYDQNQDRVLVEIKAIYSQLPFQDLLAAWSRVSHNLYVYTYTDWYFYGWTWGAGMNPANYLDETANDYPGWKRHGIRLLANHTEMDWGKVGFNRYVQAKMMWNVNADIRAIQRDFAEKMFPSAPDDFFNYVSLSIELFSQTDWQKPEANVTEFLRQAYRIFDHLRPKLKTAEERQRWEWYVLYLHEQLLEYRERLVTAKRDALANRIRFAASERLTPAQVADLKRQLVPAEQASLTCIRQIVSYDKAINRFNVLDVPGTIWEIYAPRLGRDSVGRGLGVIDISDKVPWPQQALTRVLPDIPPEQIDFNKIDAWFAADKATAAAFKPAEKVEIFPPGRVQDRTARGWNTPAAIVRKPTDFTRQGVKIDFDLPWMRP